MGQNIVLSVNLQNSFAYYNFNAIIKFLRKFEGFFFIFQNMQYW